MSELTVKLSCVRKTFTKEEKISDDGVGKVICFQLIGEKEKFHEVISSSRVKIEIEHKLDISIILCIFLHIEF